MIIKSLFVCNSEEILKEYNFNEVGVNIILGEKREDHEETNGVGKSTMIECISFLLGKTISNFYTTNEKLLNENIFIALKVDIDGNQMFLARSFNSPKNGYTLHGKSLSFHLDEWKKVSIGVYKKVIEKAILQDEQEDITFAALREYIIRDEKTGFNDIVLPNRGGLNQYKLLNYLFTLPSHTEKNIKTFRDEIEKLNSEIKLIESMNINIGDLKVKEEELTNEIEEYNRIIHQAKTANKYNNDTNRYSEIKYELNKIQNEIFENEHICKQYQRNIDDLNKKVSKIKQLENIEMFYKDIVGFFPMEVKQNYNKVQEFYDFMVESRGSYFKDKIAKLQTNLKELNTKKKELSAELEISAKIFKSNDFIEDISIVMEEQRRKEIHLAEVRLRISDYNKRNQIFDKINELQHEILRVNSMYYDEFQSYSSIVSGVKKLFNNLMEVTYNQHGFLDFEYDNRISNAKQTTTGRIKISCSIPDERSHGRLHMKINIFDLTWFLYRCINKYSTNILMHDGSYSNPDPHVKGTLLKHINSCLLENRIGQYFVTINKNELLLDDLQEFESKGMIVAKLDRSNEDKNRFFGFRL
ncbi:DUF2326 domain-containing protein [Bacillus atrophaeus]|uniref:DUF2326 domain-containing protein n=1 Tax=Bacillus atrophaeus TaxID=1452 RepID=UPI002280BEEF|nr:DUF2326 domain-containing protein [Bacillus atrophaeus]MCY8836561.1 DUF2326 domain-containing protein [Bacillus atrophaeus]